MVSQLSLSSFIPAVTSLSLSPPMSEKKKNSPVNVHSKLTVVSSRPTGPGKTHQLSTLDHAMGRHSIHIVFYYQTNPFLGSDLASLRVSLSELLCSYPPVMGRLTRQQWEEESHGGNWVVKCNDAGVRMLRAKVGATVDEWLGFGCGFDERDLTVWEDMPDDPSIWSPFCIQVIIISLLHKHFTTASTWAKKFSTLINISRADPEL